MKIDGIEMKKVRNLGFRRADPTKDFYINGKPIPQNYIVFVKISECRIYTENGRRYYDPANTPIIKIDDHSSTRMAWGKKRKSSRGWGRWIEYYGENERFWAIPRKWETTPVYVAKNGMVYQGPKHHLIIDERTKQPKHLSCIGSLCRSCKGTYRIYNKTNTPDGEPFTAEINGEIIEVGSRGFLELFYKDGWDIDERGRPTKCPKCSGVRQ